MSELVDAKEEVTEIHKIATEAPNMASGSFPEGLEEKYQEILMLANRLRINRDDRMQ